MNRKEYNKLDDDIRDFIKDCKKKYNNMVNSITDKILQPYGINHNAIIVNGEDEYTIHKAYIGSDNKIMLSLNKILYGLIFVDRVNIPLLAITKENSYYSIKWTGFKDVDNEEL